MNLSPILRPICTPEWSGFFCPRILCCVVSHYDYLSGPNRDGALPNSNRNQTCFKHVIKHVIKHDIYDSWSGYLWHDSQWERASVTHRMLRASSRNLAATNMQRTSLIFFCILCFSLWNRTRARRASWQRWLSFICFSSLVTFDLESLRVANLAILLLNLATFQATLATFFLPKAPSNKFSNCKNYLAIFLQLLISDNKKAHIFHPNYTKRGFQRCLAVHTSRELN